MELKTAFAGNSFLVFNVRTIYRFQVRKHQVRTGALQFLLDAASYLPKGSSSGILDIEEIVDHAQRYNACPYYLVREGLEEADVIFAPYNYLIDKQARRAQNIDVSNAVIIFDEAHNLESSCNESTSFDISSYEIATAIHEVDGVKWIINHSLDEEELTEDCLDVLKSKFIIILIIYHLDCITITSDINENGRSTIGH